MPILDRYLLRETIQPFLLALAVLTFVMVIQPMLGYAEDYLAKGMPLATVGFLMLTLLPQALGVTIPIAFLTGLLMALGRLSGDRESVALLACGVSPLRLLRPVVGMALLVGAVNLYVMIVAIPDANLKFLDVTYTFLAERSETDVQPRQPYEGFPGKVLFIQDARADGSWSGVFLADTSDPSRVSVTLAERGRLVLDRERREVNLFLDQARRYAPGPAEAAEYEVSQIDPFRVQVPATSVFGNGNISTSRGLAEKTIADLRADIETKEALQLEHPEDADAYSTHNEEMFLHQKFSFPVACLVFAPIALILGLHTRREGKLAGMVLGLAVVFVYYGILVQAEAWTKGQIFPAVWARWLPNIVLGLAGLALLVWKSRGNTRQLALEWPVRAGRALAARWTARKSSSAPVTQADPAPVALLIRFPELELPRLRILDSYVLAKYLRLVGLTFVALLGLSYVAAFFDRSEKLFKGEADMGLLLQFLYYFTPQLVEYIVPVATLIAVLGTVGSLTRTGELTVMRACGVSLYRAAMPLLMVALLWSGLLFFMDDRVVAYATQKAEAIDDTIRGGLPHATNIVQNRHWLFGDNGRVYYYMAYDPGGKTLHGLSVFDTAVAPYRLERHAFTNRAVFEDGTWQAQDGWLRDLRPGGEDGRARHEAFARAVLEIAPPEDFEAAEVNVDAMTYDELRTYIAQLEPSGFNLADQRMAMQRKLAFPAVTLVMTLIAVPFGVTTGRRGALYGIGIAIILAISYFLLTAIFAAAGRAEVLPPVIAAWAANIFFLIAAAYLTLTART